MAALKIQLHKSQLIHMIATKFQRLHPIFPVVSPCCLTSEIWAENWATEFQSHHIELFTSAYLLAANYHCNNTSGYYSLRVAWLRKQWYSRWNVNAIMYASWDIRNFLSTSGQWPLTLLYDIPRHRTASLFLHRVLWYWKRVITFEVVLLSPILADLRVITKCQPPSWISDFRFHLGVLPTAPLKHLTPKTLGSRWNFVPSLSRSWDTYGGSFTPLLPLQHKRH